MLQRTQVPARRPSRWEKLTLAVLTSKLKAVATRARCLWRPSLLLFTPETVLRWHRDLVRRKWTFRQRRVAGRPRVSAEMEELILRLARENPRWGYSRIHGELGKLGHAIGRSTVRDVLKRRHVPPAPGRRKKGSTWRSFLTHHGQQILACDFFTVETAFLQTIYVFFIELGTRRVHPWRPTGPRPGTPRSWRSCSPTCAPGESFCPTTGNGTPRAALSAVGTRRSSTISWWRAGRRERGAIGARRRVMPWSRCAHCCSKAGGRGIGNTARSSPCCQLTRTLCALTQNVTTHVSRSTTGAWHRQSPHLLIVCRRVIIPNLPLLLLPLS